MREASEYLRDLEGRRDVAIVGGSRGDEVTWEFGDQRIRIETTEPGRPEMVLLANAYEATLPDGRDALFLIRALSKAQAREVRVGEAIAPSAGEGGERVPSPQLETFPMASHPTDIARGSIAEALSDAGYGEVSPESLRFVLLVVALGQGETPDSEWEEGLLARRLLGATSGDMSSCTLNTNGRMSVRVVARVEDVAAAATESAIAMDAQARRARFVSGADPRSDRPSKASVPTAREVSNMLWSLVPFLIQEGKENPREVALSVLPVLRMREALLRETGARNRSGSRATLSMRCDDERTRRIAVVLVSLLPASGGPSIGVDSLGKAGDPSLRPAALMESVGGEIQSPEEARRAASALGDPLGDADYQLSRLLVAALLGSPDGRWLVAENEGAGKSGKGLPPALALLRHAAQATEWGNAAWGDWVISEVRSLMGPVAYAKAVAELVPLVALFELADGLVLVGDLAGDAPTPPDWAPLAAEARRAYAEREAERAERGVWDPYDEWDDYDDWDDGWEAPLVDTDDPAYGHIVGVCRVVGACRPALRLLDSMGWSHILSTLPALRAVLDDEGRPLPMHNDMVAAAPEAFLSLVGADAHDGEGEPTGTTFPPVVMDDGSVVTIHAEPAPDGSGVIGRMSCETGDGPVGDCVLLSGDSKPFGSVDGIIDFVMQVVLSDEGAEEGED